MVPASGPHGEQFVLIACPAGCGNEGTFPADSAFQYLSHHKRRKGVRNLLWYSRGEKVPDTFSSLTPFLLPLAERFGIGDDLIRADLVAKTPPPDVEAMRQA